MASIFNFGGFLKNTNKKREADAMPDEPVMKPVSEESTAPPKEGMSQSDFLYGTEGMRRKPQRNGATK